MHETAQIPLADRDLAHKTLAELVVWVFSDPTSSDSERFLVVGNYLIATAMVAGQTWEEREATFVEGIVAEGGSREGAETLKDYLFDEQNYGLVFALRHIPREQKGFGAITTAKVRDLDEGRFVASILETFAHKTPVN
jgi:hypothetical protein